MIIALIIYLTFCYTIGLLVILLSSPLNMDNLIVFLLIPLVLPFAILQLVSDYIKIKKLWK